MAGNSTKHQIVWQCYLDGKTPIEASKIAGVGLTNAQMHYTNFIIHQERKMANECTAKLRQIASIEDELFECIDRFNKKPNAELNNRIANLQNVYSQFNALL